MDPNSKIKQLVRFETPNAAYLREDDIPCSILLDNYQILDEDKVCLYGWNDKEEKLVASRLLLEGTLSSFGEDGLERAVILFKASDISIEDATKFSFKYLSSDATVISESTSFTVNNSMVSNESFLTVQAPCSLEEVILVDKISGGKDQMLEIGSSELQAVLSEVEPKVDEDGTFYMLSQQEEEQHASELEKDCNVLQEDFTADGDGTFCTYFPQQVQEVESGCENDGDRSRGNMIGTIHTQVDGEEYSVFQRGKQHIGGDEQLTEVDGEEVVDEQKTLRLLLQEKEHLESKLVHEKNQRERAENELEELGRRLANQMQFVDEQGERIEELERYLSMETKLNDSLKEDIDGQISTFEESAMEHDQLKMKIIEYRREFMRINKATEDASENQQKQQAQHECDIRQLQQHYKQKLTDSEKQQEETEERLFDAQEQLSAEKNRSASLETKLHFAMKENEEQLQLKEFELMELKQEIEELNEILEAEREMKSKMYKDHESTVEELEKNLQSESQKVRLLTAKYDEMQARSNASEENMISLKANLEEADKRMQEMEDLIKSSKSELEVLKKTVSAPETCIEKQLAEPLKMKSKGNRERHLDRRASSQSEKSASKTPSKSSLNKKEQKEYATPDSKWNWCREKDPVQESGYGRSRSFSGTKISFNCTETRRSYQQRYPNRQKTGSDDKYYQERDRKRSNQTRDCSFEKPEKQQALLRQHRNALLRENSRMKYSVKMLNHDCAILNFTLQQVVVEAEQKLENLYSLYMKKESECAAYESMMSQNCSYYGGNMANSYNPYSMQPEYMDQYTPDCNYVSNGAVVPMKCNTQHTPVLPINYGAQNGQLLPMNYGYCDGYFDAFRPQEVLMGQPMMLDQQQYAQNMQTMDPMQYTQPAHQTQFVQQGDHMQFIPPADQMQYTMQPTDQTQYITPPADQAQYVMQPADQLPFMQPTYVSQPLSQPELYDAPPRQT